jgi:hypothetical protein
MVEPIGENDVDLFNTSKTDDLPEALAASLKAVKSKSNPWLKVFDLAGDQILSLDQLRVAYYRLNGKTVDRCKAINQLYYLCRTGAIVQVGRAMFRRA